MSPNEIYLLIQSLMTFIIVTDIFYERIIQNKLVKRLTPHRNKIRPKRLTGEKAPSNIFLPKIALEHRGEGGPL
ncbi:MAG: hypothetical protein ACUVTM_03705 [Candidatus Bathyarchaeia archaeon]